VRTGDFVCIEGLSRCRPPGTAIPRGAWWRKLPPEERARLRALHGQVVNVQEQLPVYVLEEDAVRERLVDTGSGLFLLPGALVEDDD
jgi:hypothetical protein